MKTEDPLFGWTATDRPLDIPQDNSDPTTSTGTSINIFVRGVGVGLIHTENLMIKKLKEVRETSELELEEKEPEPNIVLLEHRLSRVHGGIESGVREES